MKVNNWLVLLLVLIGVAVGMVSLYMASLSGVMGKMGLVGGDFSQSIDANELARQLRFNKAETDCGLWSVSRKVPKYLVSKGVERVNLSGELGGERIVCGVVLVQNGNIERGVYTILKGLYYLRLHYSEIRALVESDRRQCNLLTTSGYERWAQAYLMSTRDRVHQVVLELYSQVESEKSRVEELCTD
jgi:hypothetical protein